MREESVSTALAGDSDPLGGWGTEMIYKGTQSFSLISHFLFAPSPRLFG